MAYKGYPCWRMPTRCKTITELSISHRCPARWVSRTGDMTVSVQGARDGTGGDRRKTEHVPTSLARRPPIGQTPWLLPRHPHPNAGNRLGHHSWSARVGPTIREDRPREPLRGTAWVERMRKQQFTPTAWAPRSRAASHACSIAVPSQREMARIIDSEVASTGMPWAASTAPVTAGSRSCSERRSPTARRRRRIRARRSPGCDRPRAQACARPTRPPYPSFGSLFALVLIRIFHAMPHGPRNQHQLGGHPRDTRARKSTVRPALLTER